MRVFLLAGIVRGGNWLPIESYLQNAVSLLVFL